MATEYSIQKMVSDGTLSTIALGIQYLQRNDIYIRIAGEETPQSGAPSGYTWSFVDNTTLKILPVVPSGVEVVVYRRTDVDSMYNVYSQNAQFDESTIDENNQQLLYIAQEYLEQGIPGAGVDTLEFVRDGGINTYYRIKRTDGSYSDEFAVPSAGSATKILAREALRRSYAEAGYNLVNGSFEVGGTLVNANNAMLHEASGTVYAWLGALPKAVPAASSPATTGGIGPTGWLDVGDASLRHELSSDDGFSLSEFKPSNVAGAVRRKLSEVTNDTIIDVKWFGAKGDWDMGTQTGADDTVALQSCINFMATLGSRRDGGRRAIRIPGGHYRYSALNFPASLGFGLDIIGDGPMSTYLWADHTVPGAAITSSVEYVSFRNIAFMGSLSDQNGSDQSKWKDVGYKGKLDWSLPDIDVSFFDCYMAYWKTFSEVYGRGCIYDHCNMGFVAIAMNIVCDPSTKFAPGTIVHSKETGMRHYTIRNCRFDVVSIIYEITGTGVQKDFINDILCVGNDFAQCNILIRGTDAIIRRANITGCNAVACFATGIVQVKSSIYCLMSSCNWANAFDDGIEPAATNMGTTSLWRTTGAIHGLTISNVVAKAVLGNIVQASAASSDVSIHSCLFSEVWTFPAGGTQYVFYSPFNCNGLSIIGNTFKSTDLSGTYAMYNAGVQTSNKTRVSNNSAPWTWVDYRLRYNPTFLVNGVPTASAATGLQGRYEVTDNKVIVDFLIVGPIPEASGNISISLPPVQAIAELSSFTPSYSGCGIVGRSSNLSLAGATMGPIQVNPVTQEAELWKATNMTLSRITVAERTNPVVVLGRFEYLH